MSISPQTLRLGWPRNTLRAAHRRWQAQESRLVEARQRLARQYLATRRQAEQAQTKVHQGILRTARSMLDQPLDPLLLKVKGRIQKAFALCGRGFWRRVPSALEVELAHYAASLDKICRTHDKLGARLRLAQAMLRIFARHSEFSTAPCFRLALIAPESAWLLFHLRKKRLRDRQAMQDCLSRL